MIWAMAGSRAFSAGSQPAGQVNPGAIDKLQREGHSTDDLASKSWDTFSGPDAVAFDLVVTVCDNAAGESCPIWAGSPLTVHWGIPDPAAASGDEAVVREAFDQAYARLRARINRLAALERLDKASLDAIHEEGAMTAHSTGQKLIAEFAGTALLLATVVGSGIMAENLAGGNVAIALLGNTIPTGAILVVIILVFCADFGRAFQSRRHTCICDPARH